MQRYFNRASSSNHFSVSIANERKKERSSPGVPLRTRGPNKEILDKSREVFAVRPCLHYSRASVFGYLVPRFSFHLVASVSSNLLPLESLRRPRTFGILLLRIRRSTVNQPERMPGILADLETIYARCIAGVNENSLNLT